MKLTEIGVKLVERALRIRRIELEELAKRTGVSKPVVESFVVGNEVSIDSFNVLCRGLNLDPVLVQADDRLYQVFQYPDWFHLFLRDFCYAMSVDQAGFNYLIKGDRFNLPASTSIGLQVRFDHQICILRVVKDQLTPLKCFDVPENGSILVTSILEIAQSPT